MKGMAVLPLLVKIQLTVAAVAVLATVWIAYQIPPLLEEKANLEGTVKELRNSGQQLRQDLRESDNRLQANMTSIGEAQSKLDKIRGQYDTLLSELGKASGSLGAQQAQVLKNAEQINNSLTDLSSIQQEISSDAGERWFPVIFSRYSEADVRKILADLENRDIRYVPEVYRATDGDGKPIYAITFGSKLTRSEAKERVAYAKKEGIVTDAFVWSSDRWGGNLAARFYQ